MPESTRTAAASEIFMHDMVTRPRNFSASSEPRSFLIKASKTEASNITLLIFGLFPTFGDQFFYQTRFLGYDPGYFFAYFRQMKPERIERGRIFFQVEYISSPSKRFRRFLQTEGIDIFHPLVNLALHIIIKTYIGLRTTINYSIRIIFRVKKNGRFSYRSKRKRKITGKVQKNPSLKTTQACIPDFSFSYG